MRKGYEKNCLHHDLEVLNRISSDRYVRFPSSARSPLAPLSYANATKAGNSHSPQDTRNQLTPTRVAWVFKVRRPSAHLVVSSTPGTPAAAPLGASLVREAAAEGGGTDSTGDLAALLKQVLQNSHPLKPLLDF